jgi:nucleoside-diphosphate-sugar epimerase
MTKNNHRIVILGAAGFIGFHIANFFYANCKLEIVLVDNFVNGNQDFEFQELTKLKRVKFLNLDLSRQESYTNLFTPNDIVLNCAALNGTQNFYTLPVEVIRNSGLTSILAAEFCSKAKVVLYIYFASSESYAGGVNLGFTQVPTSEQVPLMIEDVKNPRWSYAASKTIGEVATIANHAEYDLQYYILRIHNIYGPRMGFKHVIPDLIRKFSQGNFQVHGVQETRAFFYIKDLLPIISNLVFKENLVKNCVYNVGSSNEISISHLAKLLLIEMNIKSELEPMKSFKGSVAKRCPDTSFLQSQITYSETPLWVGLRETLSWYRKHDK